MEAEQGKRVRIRFSCKLEDGTIYDVGHRDTLDFVIGQGKTLSSLEKGVQGMQPGERRTIRVPASEIEEFPLTEEEASPEGDSPAGASRARKYGYDFGPGEGGGDDVFLSIPAAPIKPLREQPPAGSVLLFEVEVLAVEDADLELGENI